MQKKVFILLVLVFSFSLNLFANNGYSKQEIEKMISKMVILGFNGETINQNDEIYKNIKSGLGGVILFDKDPTDKNKIKNIRNKEQLKKLTAQLQAVSKQNLMMQLTQAVLQARGMDM